MKLDRDDLRGLEAGFRDFKIRGYRSDAFIQYEATIRKEFNCFIHIWVHSDIEYRVNITLNEPEVYCGGLDFRRWYRLSSLENVVRCVTRTLKIVDTLCAYSMDY